MQLSVPSPPASPWPARVTLMWASIVLVVCARSYLYPQTHSVYPIFSSAGQNWAAGRDCYVNTDQGRLDIYRYSPAASCVFVPFSLLPDSVGGVIWRLLQVAWFLAAFAWYVRDVWPVPNAKTQSLVWLWILLVPLSLESINNGQANVLVVASLLTATAATSRRCWNLAATCLAVAFLFKVYPLALGLLLVLAYPRQLAWRLGAAIAIGLGLPFLFQSPDYVLDQFARWLTHLSHDTRFDWPMGTGMRDGYLLLRFFLGPPPHVVYVGIQLMAALALALVARQSRRTNWPIKEQLHALFGLGCCWMMLFGPATETCTFICLAVPLSCAMVEAFQMRGVTARKMVVALVLALLLTSFINRKNLGFDLPLYVLQPIATLILFFERISRIFPTTAALPGFKRGTGPLKSQVLSPF
ncbi:MAG: DUF2029 domain-containing protein [Planctomycetes bacterium]|nr:DUF2029 domain-containing protein [Planctomycetota bacterium]